MIVSPDPSRDATPSVPVRDILGMRVHATSYDEACDLILAWAAQGESRSVCAAAVNNVMIAYEDPDFMGNMSNADLVTPDGMPLVWALKMLGIAEARRVYGPELTLKVLRLAEKRFPVGFFGGSHETLERLLVSVKVRWPDLDVAYSFSPPFRSLSDAEDERITKEMNSSGTRIMFVGLGCPKQEQWMAEHKGSVKAVMVGVGAAFDFLAGTKSQAPNWMQRSGLEWSFRLASEPRRLWKRYLKHNPRFVYLFARQLMSQRQTRKAA